MNQRHKKHGIDLLTNDVIIHHTIQAFVYQKYQKQIYPSRSLLLVLHLKTFQSSFYCYKDGTHLAEPHVYVIFRLKT